MTHPASHYSSFLALLIPIMPPYQSSCNHDDCAASYFLTHSPLLTEHHDITLTHFALPYSSCYSAPLFFACMTSFLLTSCLCTPVYSSVYSSPLLSTLLSLSPSLTHPCYPSYQSFTSC